MALKIQKITDSKSYRDGGKESVHPCLRLVSLYWYTLNSPVLIIDGRIKYKINIFRLASENGSSMAMAKGALSFLDSRTWGQNFLFNQRKRLALATTAHSPEQLRCFNNYSIPRVVSSLSSRAFWLINLYAFNELRQRLPRIPMPYTKLIDFWFI